MKSQMSFKKLISKTLGVAFLLLVLLGSSKVTWANTQDIPVKVDIADISNDMCNDMLANYNYRSSQCPQALFVCQNTLKNYLKETIENYNEKFKQNDPEDLFSGSEDLYKVSLEVFNEVIATLFVGDHKKAVILNLQGNFSRIEFVKYDYDTLRINLMHQCLSQNPGAHGATGGNGNTGATPTGPATGNAGGAGANGATGNHGVDGAQEGPGGIISPREENHPIPNESNSTTMVSDDSHANTPLTSQNPSNPTEATAGGGCSLSPNGSSGNAWTLLPMGFLAIPAIRRKYT